MERWQFWLDRGGTFTDCVAREPGTGALRVAKVPSSDDAPLVAIRAILGLVPDAPIPPCDVRMGTTLATNALLERRGARVGLVVTRGFADVLRIGDQTRPDLFSLSIERPAPIAEAVLEVDARGTHDGAPGTSPDAERLRADLVGLRARGIESLAVLVLHAYREPGATYEREIARVAASLGFADVACSHEVDPEIGLVARGQTTAADAYLTPLLRVYLARLRAALPGSTLRLMQSGGGLADVARFRGRDAVLSGPAGGVVALGHVARAAGCNGAIGFDMGGTSTDVSRVDGAPERRFETEVAGVPLRVPVMAIHTVAAGGGSLCRVEGEGNAARLTVGPESAGARPGPLCYGHADAVALTVTDVDLALGRIAGDRFPFRLDAARVDAHLATLAEGCGLSPEALAAGFFRIANESMAEAIRRVSIARGHDVREHALVVFGGAGGQHACEVARLLGMRRVVSHPLAGVLSAFGMGVAPLAWHGHEDLGRAPLDGFSLSSLAPRRARLAAAGRAALLADGAAPAQLRTEAQIALRHPGTEAAIVLPLPEALDADAAQALRHAFDAGHLRELGHLRPTDPVELVSLRVDVHAAPEPPSLPALAPQREPLRPIRRTRLFAAGRFHDDVPVHLRESLGAGAELRGPALVLEATATLCVDPGFVLRVDPHGVLLIDDEAGELRAIADPARSGVFRAIPVVPVSPNFDDTAASTPDPVDLAIFSNLYTSIAEQMGVVLGRTATSTNIRERRDYSCAIFDAAGGLVVNAPHIPVHLGAMSESVRAVHAAHPRPAPGDVYVTNDPAGGGSHLPDITVVTPVHDAEGSLRFFVASRGHHADVGGTTPGSMPPDARTLAEEGVVFRALRIVRDGVFDRDAVLGVLGSGPHPARRPAENLADLEAQIAANRTGVRLLLEACARHGQPRVTAYMAHVQDDAARRVAAAIRALPRGARRCVDALDDGTPVAVTVEVRDDGTLHIDFAGTGGEHAGNLNAPRAVTVAAVLYVLRCLVGAPIPLNGGCLRPVTLHVPARSLLDPGPERAVAAGNVETAQRVVDVLLGALGLAAASQGTMNNLTFGDATFGYYETLGGGAGATRAQPGASAVHTHMTNTRLTDAEVLEVRHPVRVRTLAVRRGSGGEGAQPGGDGLVRELELLRPLRVSLLAERRARAPWGLEGGGAGKPGLDTLDGVPLPAKASVDAPAGAVLRIETPGGGGFGAPVLDPHAPR